jgi:L,D-peptidoglycan transpeptidase YkuD (ErfK/YbiS/YcfS/YnhG family)
MRVALTRRPVTPPAVSAVLMLAVPAVLSVLTGCLPAGNAGAAGAAAGARPPDARSNTARARPAAARAALTRLGAGTRSAAQLITVTAPTHSATRAVLRAYRVSGGKRVLVFGPWTARVGYNGVARPGRKREGDGRTPSGSYGISFFFGVQRDLGFSFPFRRAHSYDYWDDDPASPRYNEWVNARKHDPGASPEPMHLAPAYNYAAVIAYNTARVPGLGSAIFLHIGIRQPTLGCVSLPRSRLIKILRWLRPKDHPLITISVRARQAALAWPRRAGAVAMIAWMTARGQPRP